MTDRRKKLNVSFVTKNTDLLVTHADAVLRALFIQLITVRRSLVCEHTAAVLAFWVAAHDVKFWQLLLCGVVSSIIAAARLPTGFHPVICAIYVCYKALGSTACGWSGSAKHVLPAAFLTLCPTYRSQFFVHPDPSPPLYDALCRLCICWCVLMGFVP